VHDLGEALSGDVAAVDQAPADGRAARERADLERLTTPLPDGTRAEILALAAENEAGRTPEAVLAKGFDKLETILQHSQGANAPGFDYAFNLDCGRSRTDAHPLLAAIREMIDVATSARIEAPAPPRA
jgi:putative hydrolase of HD superfamily